MNAEQVEIRLMPIIAGMERRGINLDGYNLQRDTDTYWQHLEELDDGIHKLLGHVVDIDSNHALADAIERAGLSTGFKSTATGKRSVAKDSLIEAIGDKELLGLLLVRGALATSLRTFLQPWLVQYKTHGRLFLKWNQFRNYTDTGARTGRLSSSPNLQNIPVEWEALLAQLEKIGYELPFSLPNIRKYIIPDPGKIFVGADYQAQEMRLLAHFAGGTLLENIRCNPDGDIHAIAAEIAGVTRRVAKTLGFAVLYGAGVGRIAASLSIHTDEAARIKARYLQAMPEIKKFTKACIDAGRFGDYVETLGGRKYFTDPTVKVINGRPVTFEYKLVNYKIQGSAADQTKMAMINYDNADQGELVLSVHDQLVAQEYEESASYAIQTAMESAYQDVLRYQVIADPEIGKNFADMQALAKNHD